MSATKRHFEELSERHGYGGELADEFMDRCARGDFRLVDSLIDLVDWMRDRTGPADGTRHLLESAFDALKANGYELSTTGPICWRRIPTAADPAPQAGPMTVAKMRAILSALPADAEIYSETEGDYPSWMVVSHAGIPFRLVRFRAGESIGEMLEREQGER